MAGWDLGTGEKSVILGVNYTEIATVGKHRMHAASGERMLSAPRNEIFLK